jgi:hypothetical protein
MTPESSEGGENPHAHERRRPALYLRTNSGIPWQRVTRTGDQLVASQIREPDRYALV